MPLRPDVEAMADDDISATDVEALRWAGLVSRSSKQSNPQRISACDGEKRDIRIYCSGMKVAVRGTGIGAPSCWCSHVLCEDNTKTRSRGLPVDMARVAGNDAHSLS